MAWLRVKDPRGRTRLEALDGDRTVVGRSATCEIRIDDPEVGLRHVSILSTDRGFLIVNETESLPIWDGEARVNNHFMSAAVDYRIGASTLTLVDDEVSDSAATPTPTETPADTSPAAPAAEASTSDEAEITSAATVMAADDDTAPLDLDELVDAAADPARATMMGAPLPEPKAPVSSATQPQGSGTTSDTDGDATRTQVPGPPPPSSTETIPGELRRPEAVSAAGEVSPAQTGKTVAGSGEGPPPPPPALSLRKPTVAPTEAPAPPPDPPEEAAEALPPDADARPVAELEVDKPPVRFPADGPATDADGTPRSQSWIWRKQDDSQSGSGPSVYSIDDGTPVVHASSQSWGWNEAAVPTAQLDAPIDLPAGPDRAPPPPPRPSAEAPPTAKSPPPAPPAASPPPAAPSSPVPIIDPAPVIRPAEEPPRPPHARVEPVLLRDTQEAEPPLPAVSKELSSGHSWMWALPQSLREGEHNPRRLSGGGGAMITAGLVLAIIGAGLIAAAFVLGLTTDAIAAAVGAAP